MSTLCHMRDTCLNAFAKTNHVNAEASEREVYQALIRCVRRGTAAAQSALQRGAGEPATFGNAEMVYERCFSAHFETGVRAGRLAPELTTFALATLRQELHPEQDLLFRCAGLQTLYHRYLLHEDEQHVELPQLMWLRVAMGT